MPTLVITLDGRELQRLPLTQGRTTIGRRPYNDIVMEHLAVSDEHTVFVLHPDGRVQALDLNSTNGTYVNGRAVLSADIGPDDRIQIARYELQVLPGIQNLREASPGPDCPPRTAGVAVRSRAGRCSQPYGHPDPSAGPGASRAAARCCRRTGTGRAGRSARHVRPRGGRVGAAP